MEILAGVGVTSARVGESRAVIESRVGPALRPGGKRLAVYPSHPVLIVTYGADDTAEMVEVGNDGGAEEVFFQGVQVTYRFMDEVVAELEARGHRAERHDMGYVFRSGFRIWSMGAVEPSEIDPDAFDDDPRLLVEGVTVAPYRDLVGAGR
ncbi:hypothetical protein [Actinoplanes utahensis]|uniref:Uncharacterized protein n=1 Tax=Actinoplanes utahensis TaxID=1869 RepID=A0A0A6US42_ACTUT|nr:hypothetical protein [Actinoplanes utahensis]KHD78251.1 hypothetical protein MB27_07035 [Actinoplanes utahensis]